MDSNKFPKEGFQNILDNLNNTASSLHDFFTKVKNDLPEEEREKIDKDIIKSQNDLTKIMSDLAKIK